MPTSCTAYNCTNRFRKGSGISFHRFPLKKPDLLKAWILSIRRKNWMPNDRSRLCSEHFTDSDFVKKHGEKLRLLKRNAVPSVFNFSKNVKKKEKSTEQNFFNFQKECKENEEPITNANSSEEFRKESEEHLTAEPYICYLSRAANTVVTDKLIKTEEW